MKLTNPYRVRFRRWKALAGGFVHLLALLLLSGSGVPSLAVAGEDAGAVRRAAQTVGEGGRSAIEVRDVLCRGPESRCVESVTNLLRDPESVVRRGALLLLAVMGQDAMSAASEVLAVGQDPDLTPLSIAALRAMGEKALPLLESAIEGANQQSLSIIFAVVVGIETDSALLLILRGLGSDEEEVWSLAQGAVANLPTPRLDRLLALLPTVPGPSVETFGVGLGQSKYPMEKLTLLLGAESSQHRQIGARALGLRRSQLKTILPLLVGRIEDPAEEVSVRVAALAGIDYLAMGPLEDRQAIAESVFAMTLDLYKSPQEVPSVRAEALGVIKRLGMVNSSLQDALLRGLSATDGELLDVSLDAARVLGCFDSAMLQAAAKLVGYHDDDPASGTTRWASLLYLSESGVRAKFAEGLLLARLDAASDPWERTLVASTLLHVGGSDSVPSAVEALLEALDNPDPLVQEQSRDLLGGLRRAETEEDVISSILSQIRKSDVVWQLRAIVALRVMLRGPAHVVKAPAPKDVAPGPTSRAMSRRDKEVMEALEAAARSENESVRTAALDALQDLGYMGR